MIRWTGGEVEFVFVLGKQTDLKLRLAAFRIRFDHDTITCDGEVGTRLTHSGPMYFTHIYVHDKSVLNAELVIRHSISFWAAAEPPPPNQSITKGRSCKASDRTASGEPVAFVTFSW